MERQFTPRPAVPAGGRSGGDRGGAPPVERRRPARDRGRRRRDRLGRARRADRPGREAVDSGGHGAQRQGDVPGRPPAGGGGRRATTRASAPTASCAGPTWCSSSAATPGGQLTLDFRVPPQGTPVIQLDIDPAEIGRNYPGAGGAARGRQGVAGGDARRGASRGPDRGALAGRGAHRSSGTGRRASREHWGSDAAPARARAHLPRAEQAPAGGRHPGVRHRPLGRVDRHHAGFQASHPELPPLCRLAGLGAAGGAGRQVRGPRAAGAVLHGRRRHLVPTSPRSRRPSRST